ncbi:MAG: hypothetical protein QOK49_2596 [Baekduia sp.]|jgi:hypothetical protein|nr:hypothetical protein [Baekduia sp.]
MFGYARGVLFLCRRDESPATCAWWRQVARFPTAAPGIVRELQHGRSVAADPLEIQQAVGWARAHPDWRDDDPPLIVSDSILGDGV